MRQITKEESIRIVESGLWKNWTSEEKVKFQLYQNCLAMPFGEFMLALSEVLGRDVFTHEMASVSNIRAEYEKRKPAPTFDEIVALFPSDKLLIIGV